MSRMLTWYLGLQAKQTKGAEGRLKKDSFKLSPIGMR